ncbi:MAG: sel1 repeat family protein [Deltaproteobacteria bacterium]|jgi:TPR repeat protein|nr:sel1 repeat family protein [Deltaproteobacteria bacterium]
MTKSTDQPSAKDLFSEANNLINTTNGHELHVKGVAILKKAVEMGDPDAQLLLANLYDDGILVPRDREKSKELYELSAEQGNMYAQFNLSLVYNE